MAEMSVKRSDRRFRVRHRGRGGQVWIYFGKLLRMFLYQSDWKVLPMSALIAGLVGMVIRRRLFINMEGALMGGFAMVMVAIWNGCFNSIQVICRERDVIKREHRSGMHISSYIVSHMLYQALLCLMQTAITLYVTRLAGVQYPAEGLFTRWFMVDFGISMFLITYAADMMSLWISCLARSTTTAMTIMPFVLIFQLVFSGGLLTLPQWVTQFHLTDLTISNPALKVIATQARYNDMPMTTLWSYVQKSENLPVEWTFTEGQIMDLLSGDNPSLQEIRSTPIKDIAAQQGIPYEGDMTVGDLLDRVLEYWEASGRRDNSYTLKPTVGELLELAGRDRIREYLEVNARQASYNPDYDYDKYNIAAYWMQIGLFILLFAALSTITLEFIDRDKR